MLFRQGFFKQILTMALKQLEGLIKGLQSFDAKAEFVNIVEANKSELTALQREQLSYGKDITGKDRIDEYRPLTKYLKSINGVGLGAVTDRVTFFMTGQLYNSLTTTLTNDVFRTTSNLPTFDKMIERIGVENYGLDPEQRQDFASNTAMPAYRERFKQVTGLIMSKV